MRLNGPSRAIAGLRLRSLCAILMPVLPALLILTELPGQPPPFTPPEPRDPASIAAPPVDPGMRPYPINLPTALQLAGSNPLDVAAASERLKLAAAQLREAKSLWLPTIQFGVDYFRHDGPIQAVGGDVSDVSKGAFFAGAGPNVIVAVTDAIYSPLAAKQVMRSRQFDIQAASNDSMLQVAEAYMTVQQARGELAGAIEATRRTEDLAGRTEKLAQDLVPELEVVRVKTELARRQQNELTAREHWRLASADLLRVLRLDPAAQVEPMEPPQLRINLVPIDQTVDSLIEIALTHRPELCSQQALVQATLKRLKQEHMRPLLPSLLVRGAATNPAGPLGTGVFGGGPGGTMSNYGIRNDIDFQLVWQLNGLGFGNRARVDERKAENQLAMIELFRTQDRIAAETNRAFAQAQLAAQRVDLAERGLKLAIESADANLLAIGQTKRAGNINLTVVRPAEAVASVQALGQAYADFFAAVADSNRAQFRLYHAIGQPAQMVAAGNLSLDQPSSPPPAKPQ